MVYLTCYGNKHLTTAHCMFCFVLWMHDSFWNKNSWLFWLMYSKNSHWVVPIHEFVFQLWYDINTLRLRQNSRHFANDVFECIFVNENVWISLKISLKFVPKLPVNNIPALVQILAWHCSGDTPLSEPMMVTLLTHICVTWPQWVKTNLWNIHLFVLWNYVL